MAIGAALENPVLAAVVFLGIPLVIGVAIVIQLRRRRAQPLEDDEPGESEDWTLPRRQDYLLAAYVIALAGAFTVITNAPATLGNLLFATGAVLLVANLLFIGPWIQCELTRRYG